MDHPFHKVGGGVADYKKLKIYNKKNNISKAPLITCDSAYHISFDQDYIKENRILNSGLYVSFLKANDYSSIFKQVRCMAPKFMKEIYDNKTVKESYEIKLDVLQEQEPIFVYTDGACTNNGKPTARAGFGVYFGKDDPRNVSEAYKGPQTNNVAELLAIIKALSILRQEIEDGEKIVIYSDSTYSIRCCTDYGEKMEKKNWIP